MTNSSPVPAVRIKLYGRKLAGRLVRLEATVGPRGLRKFKTGKLRVPGQFGGQYVDGVMHSRDGRDLILHLLDQLQAGAPVPLCDVDSYYAHDKQWPHGMRIVHGRLLDIWEDPEVK